MCRTDCADYASVRWKSLCRKQIMQEAMAQNGYADYASVR